MFYHSRELYSAFWEKEVYFLFNKIKWSSVHHNTMKVFLRFFTDVNFVFVHHKGSSTVLWYKTWWTPKQVLVKKKAWIRFQNVVSLSSSSDFNQNKIGLLNFPLTSHTYYNNSKTELNNQKKYFRISHVSTARPSTLPKIIIHKIISFIFKKESVFSNVKKKINNVLVTIVSQLVSHQRSETVYYMILGKLVSTPHAFIHTTKMKIIVSISWSRYVTLAIQNT